VSLSDEWEVGLAEISFPRNWYHVSEQTITVSCTDCKNISPPLDVGQSPAYRMTIGIPSGVYINVADLVHFINLTISKAYRMSSGKPFGTADADRFIAESEWPKFQINKQRRRVETTIHPNMTIEFSDKLSRILGTGVTINSLHSKTMTLLGITPYDIEGGLHALYVYCDLLECVPVGDTMAPLLRIVEINGPRDDMINVSYDNPRYFPLQKKTFDSVEIDIRDDFGDPIPFESGKLIVTLHFRRAKDAYYLG
jgi:hypothetical protein